MFACLFSCLLQTLFSEHVGSTSNSPCIALLPIRKPKPWFHLRRREHCDHSLRHRISPLILLLSSPLPRLLLSSSIPVLAAVRISIRKLCNSLRRLGHHYRRVEQPSYAVVVPSAGAFEPLLYIYYTSPPGTSLPSTFPTTPTPSAGPRPLLLARPSPPVPHAHTPLTDTLSPSSLTYTPLLAPSPLLFLERSVPSLCHGTLFIVYSASFGSGPYWWVPLDLLFRLAPCHFGGALSKASWRMLVTLMLGNDTARLGFLLFMT